MPKNGRVRFLSIDAGTTSLKAAICTLDGKVVGMARQEYVLETPGPAMVELEPETYWQACCQAVREALRASGADADQVVALSISSQGETMIPLDEQGRPTRKAIVWLDNRAVAEAQAISQHFGRERIYQVTGQPDATPTWPACKIMWIHDHEPEVMARTARFLLLEDYLLYRLTGQAATEFSLQSSSIMLDIHSHTWWQAMLDYVGIGVERLPRLMAPGEVVGPITARAAADLGLTTQTLAVTGALDAVAGAVGAGGINPGVVTEATGGALAIVAPIDKPLCDPGHRVPCHCHATAERYCMLPWSQTAGMALKWFRDQFYALEDHVARSGGLDTYALIDNQARRVPAGSEGLIVLPHLEGAACPEFNPAARGVFYGLTLRHTRGHLARAIMESVAFMLRRDLEIVRELGVSVNEVRSTGGGARSDVWLQIKADVLQTSVGAVQNEEVASLGVAALAATATGYFDTLEQSTARLVDLRQRVMPLLEHRQVYVEGYQQYLELYNRLATMFR